MNKGDIVLVKAQAIDRRIDRRKEFFTFPYFSPKKGIVLGYSFIRTGRMITGGDYDPDYLIDITSHKVWVIELFENGNRYLKPIRVLEEDIILEEME